MERYFLADIIGDGTEENEFRPSVANYYDLGWSAEQPADTQTGRPLNDWCLVKITQGDLTPLVQDPSVDALPNCPLATPINQIDPDQLAGMREALTRRKIGSAIIETAGDFGGVLAAIAVRANAGTLVPTAAQLEL